MYAGQWKHAEAVRVMLSSAKHLTPLSPRSVAGGAG